MTENEMICDECKIRPGTMRIDPYAEEIQGVEIERCLCDQCFSELCAEI
jgi:hypothetical protein